MSKPSTEPADLVRLMMSQTAPMEFTNWADLLAVYAFRLSEVAPKLTEEQLWRMIAVGAAVYQRGYREFEAGVVGGHLLDVVRKAAKSDDPQNPTP